MPITVRPHRAFIFFLILLFFVACRERPKPPAVVFESEENGGVTLMLDSAAVEEALKETAPDKQIYRVVRNFYRNRDFAAAWVTRDGINDFAGSFLNLMGTEVQLSPDDTVSAFHRLISLYSEAGNLSPTDKRLAELELRLTVGFYEYARRHWGGVHDTVLRKVRWFISRKKVDYSGLLDEFLTSGKPALTKVPVYHQYWLLKEKLRQYVALESTGQWPEITDTLVKLQPGDSSEFVPILRKLLYYAGDLEEDNGEYILNGSLVQALSRFQHRHGLTDEGFLGKATLKALATPLQKRIRQILINMERCRWVPLELKGNYLVANIPEFRLYVYKDDRIAWSCKIVTGKSDPVFKTIVFNDSVEFVVFNPYWNIPKNIFFKETLPQIKKDPAYLVRNNLELVDRKGNPIPATTINWDSFQDHFPYIIRERPGPSNSLGRVKFLFPNPHEIYFHDTPSKNLFSETSRAFSHGCVRLEEPLKLARHLLAVDSNAQAGKIDELLASDMETFVKLRKKVPVFISYFTAWVDRKGKLNFRDDVYGHDTLMEKVLFPD